MSAAKKRAVYWLCQQVTDVHRRKATLLAERDYEVTFFNTLDDMVTASLSKRSGVLVIGDEGEETDIGQAIHLLSSLPLTGGARLILSLSQQRNSVKNLAAATAFRDLLPLNIPDNQWMRRFVYATASRAISLSAPQPQITFNSMASVALPSRVVWMSPERVLLESRTTPKRDDSLTLSGPLAEAMGVKSLSLVVEETRKHELVYRFSDAVVARWTVPVEARERSQSLLAKIKHTSKGPRCRVYVVVQDTVIRGELLDQLQDDRVDVSTALQKHAIAEEPRFFSPDIVFIEDRFCIGEDATRFQQMLDVLSNTVPVVVIGRKVPIDDLQDLDSRRRFFTVPQLPQNLLGLLFARYLPPAMRKAPQSDPEAAYLSDSDPLSLAQISVPARVYKLHPTVITVGVPIHIGAFGLCRVDAPMIKPLINRAPYAKITDAYVNERAPDPNFPHVLEAYLVDVDRDDQKKISSQLSTIVQDHFGPPISAAVDDESSEGSRSAAASQVASAAVERLRAIPQTEGELDDLQVSAVNKMITKDPLISSLPSAQHVEEDIAAAAAAEKQKLALGAVPDEVPDEQQQKQKWFMGMFWQWMIFIAILTFVGTAAYLSLEFLSENFERSGGQYTDAIKRLRGEE